MNWTVVIYGGAMILAMSWYAVSQICIGLISESREASWSTKNNG